LSLEIQLELRALLHSTSDNELFLKKRIYIYIYIYVILVHILGRERSFYVHQFHLCFTCWTNSLCISSMGSDVPLHPDCSSCAFFVSNLESRKASTKLSKQNIPGVELSLFSFPTCGNLKLFHSDCRTSWKISDTLTYKRTTIGMILWQMPRTPKMLSNANLTVLYPNVNRSSKTTR